MTRGVNKAILIGNLGQDPEVRYTPNGSAVCNVSLATTESWKDKQSNERQESTEWHRLVFFGKLAEITGEYLRKGSQIYAEGRLQTRKWQDRSGNDRSTTEIIVSEMHILGSRNSAGNSAHSEGNQPAQGSNKDRDKGKDKDKDKDKDAAPTSSTAPADSVPGSDFDDDIPF